MNEAIERGARAMQGVLAYQASLHWSTDKPGLVEINGWVDLNKAFSAGLAAMWQDISTAPKDTPVFLYFPFNTVTGKPEIHILQYKPTEWGIHRWEHDAHWSAKSKPTHWMPIFPPPAATEAT